MKYIRCGSNATMMGTKQNVSCELPQAHGGNHLFVSLTKGRVWSWDRGKTAISVPFCGAQTHKYTGDPTDMAGRCILPISHTGGHENIAQYRGRVLRQLSTPFDPKLVASTRLEAEYIDQTDSFLPGPDEYIDGLLGRSPALLAKIDQEDRKAFLDRLQQQAYFAAHPEQISFAKTKSTPAPPSKQEQRRALLRKQQEERLR